MMEGYCERLRQKLVWRFSQSFFQEFAKNWVIKRTNGTLNYVKKHKGYDLGKESHGSEEPLEEIQEGHGFNVEFEIKIKFAAQ